MRLQLLALLAISAACADTTAPASPFAGTYQLATVNGQPLPYAIAPTAQLTSITLTILNDSTWSEIRSYVGGNMEINRGTWNHYSAALGLWLIEYDAARYSGGSLAGNSLTINGGGITMVFRK